MAPPLKMAPDSALQATSRKAADILTALLCEAAEKNIASVAIVWSDGPGDYRVSYAGSFHENISGVALMQQMMLEDWRDSTGD